ncbi:hypothetical protein PIB30_025135 [Stylosanthes scabra]|uniref:Uncharacterized protein n=1 Tax=Stylosanthes scabra TaxID=79078 RepID=A0ABU6W8E5_9FABA|nr:hypothetical protein [Stylosanthes scabra]
MSSMKKNFSTPPTKLPSWKIVSQNGYRRKVTTTGASAKTPATSRRYQNPIVYQFFAGNRRHLQRQRGWKFQQSATVKVPVGAAKARKNAGDLATVDDNLGGLNGDRVDLGLAWRMESEERSEDSGSCITVGVTMVNNFLKFD